MNIPIEYENRIVKALVQCGVQMNLQGYVYLKDAIYLAIQDPQRKWKVTGMYREIGKEYGVKGQCVERCIRHCIEEMFLTRETMSDDLNRLISACTNPQTGKMPNSTFIYTVAEKINLDIRSQWMSK